MDVILIHLGGEPPAHLEVCRAQAERIAGCPPIVVDAARGAACDGARLAAFRRRERLTDMGLDGFWRYTCERFFVLEEVMREERLDRALHIESDNLLYAAPAELEPWLTATYGATVATCPLTSDEDTAAVLYVGSLAALTRFNQALLKLVKMRPGRLLRRHGGSMANEMRMLYLLRAGGLSASLPTTVERAQALEAPFVFDPASYGQHLDGTPGEPGRPYATDVHEVGRELLAGRCELVRDPPGLLPEVRSTATGARLALANLHIHSKRLARWAPA